MNIHIIFFKYLMDMKYYNMIFKIDQISAVESIIMTEMQKIEMILLKSQHYCVYLIILSTEVISTKNSVNMNSLSFDEIRNRSGTIEFIQIWSFHTRCKKLSDKIIMIVIGASARFEGKKKYFDFKKRRQLRHLFFWVVVTTLSFIFYSLIQINIHVDIHTYLYTQTYAQCTWYTHMSVSRSCPSRVLIVSSRPDRKDNNTS